MELPARDWKTAMSEIQHSNKDWDPSQQQVVADPASGSRSDLEKRPEEQS
jgi:hypothetical protein